MTEPVYEFVKGQGWVIKPVELFTNHFGMNYRVEYRSPVTGERYQKLNQYDHKFSTEYVASRESSYYANDTESTYRVLIPV